MKNLNRALTVFCTAFLIITIAPVIGYVTSQVVLLDRTQNPIAIRDASSNGIQEAFAFPITLMAYQKAYIEFSMALPNSTSTLKILDKDIYETNYFLNNSPIEIPGEDFLNLRGAYLREEYPSDSATIYEQGSRYIRFSGGIYGSEIVYMPGDYVILVYGSYDQDDSKLTISFNLLVKKDGPGDFIEFFLISFGLLILICYSVIVTINYIRKIELPYKKKIRTDKILLIQYDK